MTNSTTNKRTVRETIELFHAYQREFEKKARGCEVAGDELGESANAAKADAYGLAAFELERNTAF